MDLIDRNLASQTQAARLGDLFDREGSAVKIRYSHNGGGYENHLYFITGDGAALHIDTVHAQLGEVDFTDPSDPQWYLVGYEVNYEDPDLIDAHTGKEVPAAYITDDEANGDDPEQMC